MKSLARSVYHNPYQLWLGLILLLVAGLSAFNNLPRLEDPRLLNRFPVITTTFPGASPEQVEALITQPMEEAMREVPQVAKLETTSSTGFSVVAIELDDSVTRDNQAEIIAKVREEMEQVVMPAGAMTPELATNDGDGAYTYIAGVKWVAQGEPDRARMTRAAEVIEEKLRKLSGTEYVTLIGEVTEEILIDVDQRRLAQAGLGLPAIQQALAGADINGAAGTLTQGESQLSLNLAGSFDNLERIRDLPIRVADSNALRLGDIASVSQGWKTPEETRTRVNGLATVMVAARVNPQVRVDNWTQAAKSVVAEVDASLAQPLAVFEVFEQAKYTGERLDELGANLVLGAAIVLGVVFVFMGWRAALVVGLALPLTFSGVLFGLSLLGVQIHQMSVFGMIIALGLLIDNAIVMVDEVRARLRAGDPPLQALTGAVGFLSGPLFASTLTTVLGFAPILLLNGAIGDFIGAIAVSVSLALLISYGLSMTLLPALAARYSGSVGAGFAANGLQIPALSRAFRGLILRLTQYAPVGVLLAMVPAIAGFALVGTLGLQFFPAADRDHFEVKITLPSTASLAQTEQALDQVEQLVSEQLKPIQATWSYGESHPAVYYNQIREQRRNDAYLHGVLTFESADQSRAALAQIQPLLDQALPQARVVALPFGQGPPVAFPIAFRLFGEDLKILADLGLQMRSVVQAHPEILHSNATISEDALRMGFVADEARLRQVGMSLSDLALQMSAASDGILAGDLMDGLTDLPVRVRLQPDQRDQLSDLSDLQIQTPSGQQIALTSLGQWELQPEPGSITRYNGERLNTIGAWLVPGALAIDVSGELAEQLAQIPMPPGYRFEVAGESEEQGDSIGALAVNLPILLVAIVATLILSFRSVRLAGVVMSVGVLSIGGGLFALAIAGYPLGFNPILGTAGLLGVAINGSIVVLAAIQADPKARQGDPAALTDAALSCSRHILSTTLTTMGGFLPLIVGGGLFWPPLAVVIAGGVGFSVLLGLVMTPALYRMLIWAGGRRFPVGVALDH